MNLCRRVLAGFLSFILLLSVLAHPVHAVDFTPRTQALFNNPYGTTAERRKIVSYTIQTINAVPKGGTIRMAIFAISDDNFAKALIAAKNRGVSVKIIVTHVQDPSPSHTMLVNALGTNRTSRNFIAWCNGSCMSTQRGSIMHAKLYTFSQAGSARSISMVGSANPSIHNIYQSWNDMYVLANDATIYDANVRYFNDLVVESDNPDYFWSQSSGKYRMSYFPRERSLSNFYMDALNKVRCTGAASGYGYQGRTVIRVNMYFWGNDMLNVATKLQKLDAAGCEVQIVLNNNPEYHLGTKILPALHVPSEKYGKMSIYDTYARKYKTHEKYLLINGVYDGKPNKKLVYTGSANWTHNSMANDNDVVLRIDDPATYDAYFRHFILIKTKHTTLVE